MDFTIRKLFLSEDINAPEGNLSPDKTAALYECTTSVKAGNLEPPDSSHFETAVRTGKIPAGQYFFLQGFSKTNVEAFIEGNLGAEASGKNGQNTVIRVDPEKAALLIQAAKELWLEALWQEINLADGKFFLRLLEENSFCVFQIFRPLGAA